MADGLDLVRGCNIIDDLVAKQTQLKELEAELSRTSDAIAADRAALESAKAALDADENAMVQRRADLMQEVDRVRAAAQVQAEKIAARKKVEIDLLAEATQFDAETAAAQTRREADMYAEAEHERLTDWKTELKRKEEALDERVATFEAEVAAARHHTARTAGRVDLDVGGVRFSTSVETLTEGDSPYFKVSQR